MTRAELLEQFAVGVPDWVIAALAEKRPLSSLVTVTPMHDFDTGADRIALATIGTNLGTYPLPEGAA